MISLVGSGVLSMHFGVMSWISGLESESGFDIKNLGFTSVVLPKRLFIDSMKGIWNCLPIYLYEFSLSLLSLSSFIFL